MEHLLNIPFDWQAAACLLIVVMAVSFGIAAYLSRDADIGPAAPVLEPIESDAEPVTEPGAINRRGADPIMRRVYERWLDAYLAGDRATRLRHESRMLHSGFEPPADEAECKAMIETLKGDRP